MKKKFNISGPCISTMHYMISPQSRCTNIDNLINEHEYFVLHAARQSGKTTFLIDLVHRLNESGNFYAIYCTLESVQKIDEPEKGIQAIINAIKKSIKYHKYFPKKDIFSNFDYNGYTTVLVDILSDLCIKLDKPLVILFDEVDCLSNGTLISFLRQLRDGYVNRSTIPFISSIGLIGMRNIRDYKSKIREDSDTLGSASPFNIVTEVFTLNNFTLEEIKSLLVQHKKQIGQIFSEAAIKKIYVYTQGQPWLVNAVAREIVVNILKSDEMQTIKSEHVHRAVQTIIERRDTHIDSLLERLNERRVQRILTPVITGDAVGFDMTDDDYQYVTDLGLIRTDKGRISPSNPIYADLIVRKLTSVSQMEMEASGFPPSIPTYIKNGKLSMNSLLKDFQKFWRENSKIWMERYEYKESAPHIILMAFLQRVINHGGTISRELASGRGRLDLCVDYENKRYPVELKIRRDRNTVSEGKKQLWDYMDTLACDQGWLIVFDTRKSISWTKKIFFRSGKIKKKTINVVGC